MTGARWLAVGACATCLACADITPLSAPGMRTDAIVGGEPSGAEDDGVLLIRAVLEDDPELICTASLVAENLLLTARHCVSYLREGLFDCSVRGELIEVTPDAGKLGLHIPAESIEVYASETPRDEPIARGVQVISTLWPVICVNDIAFIVLDRALKFPLVPMRVERPAELHEQTTLVGYGIDDSQTSIEYRTQPRRRKTELEIAGIGPDLLEDGVTTVSPRTLIVDGPSGCVGDSGGPLLAAQTGAVLGVYSLQEGPRCSDPNVRHHMTHVPPFQALIEEAFAAAGSEPLLEPGAVADGGSAGAAGASNSHDSEAGAGGESAEPQPHPAPPSDSSCAMASSRGSASLVVLVLGACALRRRRVGSRLSPA